MKIAQIACDKIPDAIRALATAIRRRYPYGKNKDRCLDAAWELNNQIPRKYFPSVQFGAVNGNPHCWVECFVNGHQMVLDITVDQFGRRFPAILWGKIANHPEYTYDEGRN